MLWKMNPITSVVVSCHYSSCNCPLCITHVNSNAKYHSKYLDLLHEIILVGFSSNVL